MEPMRATVETTGNNALIPGKAVFSLNLKQAIPIPITPNHGTYLFFQNDSGTKRSRAPKPSSHALVGSE